MLHRVWSIWNPAQFHGHHKKRDYFEGWYFKCVAASGEHRYAIIPGMFIHRNPAESHCFVQTLDGLTGKTTYHRYPADQFWAAKDEFDVRVGPNRFTLNHIQLELESLEQTIKGELEFKGLQPWPVTLLSPGIMGPFAFIPKMEGCHGVLSFNHKIYGTLEINGDSVDFNNGNGYIEKDWGSSFPQGYIWLQTNHFERNPNTCLTASIAVTKWRNYAFRGFIIGLWYQNVLYKFTTYTRAKIHQLRLTDTHVFYAIEGIAGTGSKRGRYRLDIEATRSEGGLLKAPYRVAMLERVVESLTASAHVRLSRIEKGREVMIAENPHQTRVTVVFDDVGQYAGLEVAGDLRGVVDIDESSK